jgi:hypothetical protein
MVSAAGVSGGCGVQLIELPYAAAAAASHHAGAAAASDHAGAAAASDHAASPEDAAAAASDHAACPEHAAHLVAMILLPGLDISLEAVLNALINVGAALEVQFRLVQWLPSIPSLTLSLNPVSASEKEFLKALI